MPNKYNLPNPFCLLLFAFCLLPFFFCSAETLHVAPQVYHRTWSHTPPVLQRVRPGDTVVTKTLDAGGQDEKGEHRHEAGNPLTGPFYIEGTEPGDAVAVHFRRMRLNRNWGLSAYRLGLYSLTPNEVEKVYSDAYKQDLIRKGRSNLVPWDLDLARNMVKLREPASARHKMEFPARPMLGCVGVAAPGDQAPPSSISGSYGGNLDYNVIGEGATVILPVYHTGALLYMGDGHALQADGEPTGTGVETSMDVEFSVEVRKNAGLSGPRVETATDLISIGSQPEFESSLNRALQLATTDMVHWLAGDYKLEPWAAHLLVGYQGKYEVVTVAGTMALKIPKSALPR
ncbi:MAG: acetamidase/formamidase family protein [Acidobacteria bacterium]|nr:acetamidase/formamidase family protein [Acidobacteriota bacterium]